MTWSYGLNGLVISHRLQQLARDRFELCTVDFDGYARAEPFTDESGALRRQMALERVLIAKGWHLQTFRPDA